MEFLTTEVKEKLDRQTIGRDGGEDIWRCRSIKRKVKKKTWSDKKTKLRGRKTNLGTISTEIESKSLPWLCNKKITVNSITGLRR